MTTKPRPPSLVLAPMEGVTDPLLRALVARVGGAELLCTEFVRITSQPQSPRALRRVVVKAAGLPLSVQVMGRDPERLREAALLVQDAGADVVDLNLGCPSPKAARGGVGAAMLKDLGLLRDVVVALREVVRVPLTAKMRAGFDDANGAERIGETLEAAGVDWICVHPRRRCDQYTGVADWRIIRSLVGALGIPVLGNGDVWYADDALRMRAETGCAGVMIGRPALRNPFIFRQIADLTAGRAPFAPCGDDLLGFLEGLAAAMVAELGHARTGRLKELVRYVGRAVRDDGAFVKEALRTPDADGMLDVARRHLAGKRPDELDVDAVPSRLPRLMRSGSVALSTPLLERVPAARVPTAMVPDGPSALPSAP